MRKLFNKIKVIVATLFIVTFFCGCQGASAVNSLNNVMSENGIDMDNPIDVMEYMRKRAEAMQAEKADYQKVEKEKAQVRIVTSSAYDSQSVKEAFIQFEDGESLLDSDEIEYAITKGDDIKYTGKSKIISLDGITYAVADFSDLTEAGEYYFLIDDILSENSFRIEKNLYKHLAEEEIDRLMHNSEQFDGESLSGKLHMLKCVLMAAEYCEDANLNSKIIGIAEYYADSLIELSDARITDDEKLNISSALAMMAQKKDEKGIYSETARNLYKDSSLKGRYAYEAAGQLYKLTGEASYKKDFENQAQTKTYSGFSLKESGYYGGLAYVSGKKSQHDISLKIMTQLFEEANALVDELPEYGDEKSICTEEQLRIVAVADYISASPQYKKYLQKSISSLLGYNAEAKNYYEDSKEIFLTELILLSGK